MRKMENERRNFSRIEFNSEAVLIVKNQRFISTLEDISLKGALLHSDKNIILEKGDKLDFELKLDETDIVMQFKSILRYRKNDKFGLEFEGLDLECMQHLRRLVELNIGDSDKIKNELFFLTN